VRQPQAWRQRILVHSVVTGDHQWHSTGRRQRDETHQSDGAEAMQLPPGSGVAKGSLADTVQRVVALAMGKADNPCTQATSAAQTPP
jgi:hypothetical protein